METLAVNAVLPLWWVVADDDSLQIETAYSVE